MFDPKRLVSIEALPAGDYLLVVLEDVEDGEWFDPAFLEVKARAVTMRVDEGDQRPQDLKGSAAP